MDATGSRTLLKVNSELTLWLPEGPPAQPYFSLPGRFRDGDPSMGLR